MFEIAAAGVESTYVSIAEFEAETGIAAATVRGWVHRGLLTPATYPNGRPRRRGRENLYSLLALARAEKARRDHAHWLPSAA